MENPATWGEAERVVNSVLQAHFDAAYRDAFTENPPWGLSLERRITDALRAAGLLAERAEAYALASTLEKIRQHIQHCGEPRACLDDILTDINAVLGQTP